MSDAATAEITHHQPLTSTPDEYPLRLVGFQSQDEAEKLGLEVSAVTNSISQHFNLSSLDGITIAPDIGAGLVGLDHGYPVPQNLRPAKSARDGISYAPLVVRDNQVKTHIIFRASDVSGLLTPEDADAHAWSLQVVGYECAQVTVRHAFYQRFPDVRNQQLPILDLMRWTAITNAWEAFACSSLSASMGENPTPKHSTEFLRLLAQCPSISNKVVADYRNHRNVDHVLRGVFEVWGTLVKFAGYFLGALDSTGKKIEDFPEIAAVLEGHWFKPALDSLQETFVSLAKDFGRWESSVVFEPIGNLTQELVASAGLHITPLPDGTAHVHIPMTPATS